jgi:hypothetical protein
LILLANSLGIGIGLELQAEEAINIPHGAPKMPLLRDVSPHFLGLPAGSGLRKNQSFVTNGMPGV